MAQDAFGDLVVVIPGILGSRLARREGGKHVTVWDFSIASLPALLKALVSGDIVLEGDGIDPPDDGIGAVDLFSYQWLPGFFGVDDYTSLVETLERSAGPGQVIRHPYDWRLSNRHAARGLERVAMDALARWRRDSGRADAKLWLVCHSMGGLVARYFCEALGGAEHTRAIITIGTPHRGSVCALDALANGMRFGPMDVTRLVRSLPSVYELLPLFPVLRQGPDDAVTMVRIAELFGLDPVTGDDLPGWSDPAARGLPPPLPGLDRGMLKRALQFHAEIRGPAEAREARGDPSPYRQEAFFNRRQPTALSARAQDGRVRIFKTYPEEKGGRWVEDDARGDGTVPSFAAVPIEWDSTSRAVAVGEKHTAMQSGTALRDTLFNWMRPLDVRAKRGVGTADDDVVALDVPPVVAAGEDLVVTASSRRPAHGFIELLHVESGTKASRPLLLAGRETPWREVFRRPRPGVHRVSVLPGDRRLPVISDYAFVVEA